MDARTELPWLKDAVSLGFCLEAHILMIATAELKEEYDGPGEGVAYIEKKHIIRLLLNRAEAGARLHRPEGD